MLGPCCLCQGYAKARRWQRKAHSFNAISGGVDAGARWLLFRLRRVRRVRTRSAAETRRQDVGCRSPRFGRVLVSHLRGLGFRSDAVLAPGQGAYDLVGSRLALLSGVSARPEHLSRLIIKCLA
jgi:hypothetical protein